MDYKEWLRRLAMNDSHLASICQRGADLEPPDLDPKSVALIRIAALVSVGGAVPSYGELADAAVNAGATTAEIVGVLVAVVPIVGLPCVVAAAPNLALSLGYDIEEVEDH